MKIDIERMRRKKMNRKLKAVTTTIKSNQTTTSNNKMRFFFVFKSTPHLYEICFCRAICLLLLFFLCAVRLSIG